MPKTLTVVSLFSGAGGLDLGLERAGFSTLSASDLDPDCVATLRENQRARIRIPGTQRRFLEAARVFDPVSVADLRASDLRPRGARSTWAPDVLVGGPPCQPFSSAGRMGSIHDPRGRLFEHFVRIAEELRPRFVLFENVRGLVTARGERGEPGEVIRRVQRAFERAGFATTFAVLNAADYGAPQRRVRCFMLASRLGPVPEFPEPTHAERPRPELFEPRRPWVTLGDFLATLPPPPLDEIVRPSARLAKELIGLAPGTGLRSAGARETTRPGGHWGYRQGTFIADPARPARTVTAASSQDWILDPDLGLRRLALSECAALQGFPSEWRFMGGKAARFKQVGNAVPAIFGEVLGLAIREAMARRGDARSKPLPTEFHAAIDYTRREQARNGESRRRARAQLAAGAKLERFKGLGAHDSGG